MRISVEPSDPGFNPNARLCAVLVDGRKHVDIITADEATAYVKHYVRENGKLVEDEHGQPVTKEEFFESVEILVKPPEAAVLLRRPNFLRTAEWLQAAGKQAGNSLHASVQVGVHIEEMLEFLEQLVNLPPDVRFAIGTLQALANDFKKHGKVAFFRNDAEALDALCDTEVTANGVAYLMGWNKLLADQLVLNANDDKFIDGKPVILAGGKIGKRAGWVAPDLTQCVTPQAMGDGLGH